uniref:Ig-like domain-containing protein n=1 Tax=Oreochromis niloticus TaxID=8128 RepID=I3JM86_ORENI
MRGNEANRVISVSQGGLYHCRGGRGDPVYYTEDSSDVTVKETLPSKPTVSLQPSWTQIYSGETVTVRCEIQGGEGAQWTYEWRAAKLNTPPTSNEYRIIRATESDSGGYSCRGRRDYFFSEWSDIITLTVSYKPRPVLTVSPSWLSPGASVTLNCEVEHPSAGWSFYWYKAVPDLSEKSSSYELLPDGSGTAQDSYIIHGQTHTAGYVCRAGRGDPEYHTDHSQPKFLWSAGQFDSL